MNSSICNTATRIGKTGHPRGEDKNEKNKLDNFCSVGGTVGVFEKSECELRVRSSDFEVGESIYNR